MLKFCHKIVKIGDFIMVKINAFTLAETLITLSIIGIVAALTIPSLISKHEKRTTALRVKKAYSELYQALTLSQTKNGPIAEWNYSNTDNIDNNRQFIKKYILPYYKLQECSTQHNNNCGLSVSDTAINYILPNGTGISIKPYAQTIYVLIDVNGGKKPNYQGRDAFYFCTKDNKLVATGWNIEITRDDILNGKAVFNNQPCLCKKYDKNDTENPIYLQRRCCTPLLILDGWEFKDDYPW